MSTTFQVFPGTHIIPTFQQLLERSTKQLHLFLSSHGITSRPAIEVRIQRKDDDVPVPFNLNSPLSWSDDNYAWFHIPEIPGGTDAYFWPVDDVTIDYWSHWSDRRSQVPTEFTRNCLAIGHCWSFRRSAGQLGITNVAYGLIAGCLAELTEGFVFSDDCAWDWERMPALPNELFTWYFVPSMAIGENFRDWSQCCIDGLYEELGA